MEEDHDLIHHLKVLYLLVWIGITGARIGAERLVRLLNYAKVVYAIDGALIPLLHQDS